MVSFLRLSTQENLLLGFCCFPAERFYKSQVLFGSQLQNKEKVLSSIAKLQQFKNDAKVHTIQTLILTDEILEDVPQFHYLFLIKTRNPRDRICRGCRSVCTNISTYWILLYPHTITFTLNTQQEKLQFLGHNHSTSCGLYLCCTNSC